MLVKYFIIAYENTKCVQRNENVCVKNLIRQYNNVYIFCLKTSQKRFKLHKFDIFKSLTASLVQYIVYKNNFIGTRASKLVKSLEQTRIR